MNRKRSADIVHRFTISCHQKTMRGARLYLIAALALAGNLSLGSGSVALAQGRDHGIAFARTGERAGLASRSSEGDASVRVRALAEQLPLAFVPNRGQFDPSVRFQARTGGATLFFAPDQIVLSLPTQATEPCRIGKLHSEPGSQPDIASPLATIRLLFHGANSSPEISGENSLAGFVNYYSGSDPTLWQMNIPTYASIVYRELYPGIDAHYDGSNRNLKATYVVSAGADPSAIRWSYEGADTRVDEASGDLIVTLVSRTEGEEAIELRERAPVAWQMIEGERIPIAARYTIGSDGLVGFVLPEGYDQSQALTLDPILFLGQYLGGSLDDFGLGIALDLWGDIYVAGYTESQNFPLKDAYQTIHNSPDYDAFVTKYNPQGTLIYSTYLGGVQGGNSFFGDDRGRRIAVDIWGNAYVVGYTNNSYFPTTAGVLRSSPPVGYDAFVAKFGPGGALSYSTLLGGSGNDYGMAIAVDIWSNAYVTGDTASADFPTPGGFQITRHGTRDAFVAELNPTGSALVYSTYLGGGGEDWGQAIAVDIFLGNAYVAGYTSSATDFPTFTAYQSSYGGGMNDGFVTKLTPTGNGMVYSTYLGGGGFDSVDGITFDASLNVYLTGQTDSPDFPIQWGEQSTNAGGSDAFVTELNTAGSALVYSTYLGGSGEDIGVAIAIDSSARVYVTGYTTSSNFPTSKPFQANYAGNTDAFLTRLNSGGYIFYSTYLGGSGHDEGWGIAVDGADVEYVTGYTSSTNFPTKSGSLAGGNDAFVVKIGMVPTTITLASSLNPSKAGQSVTFTATVTGTLQNPSVGDVLFWDGTAPLALVTVDAAGKATYSASLKAGTHAMHADYLGNNSFLESYSPTITQTVTAVLHLPVTVR